jgi:hypothetical protein
MICYGGIARIANDPGSSKTHHKVTMTDAACLDGPTNRKDIIC